MFSYHIVFLIKSCRVFLNISTLHVKQIYMMPMLLSSIKVGTNKFNTGVKDIFCNKLIKILKIHFVT